MARKTRKNGKGKSMTVSKLRKSMEHIDSYVRSKVGKLSDSDMLKAFQKEWKKCFGKNVDATKAREYLALVAKGPKGQKGGAVLVGAPLHYEMAPGGGGPSVPPYVSDGFGFANMDSLSAGGPKDYLNNVTVPAGMGSNKVSQEGGRRSKGRRTRNKKQRGGALFPSLSTAAAEFFNRPFGTNGTHSAVPALAPTTSLQDVTMLVKGHNQFSSPLPEINPLPYSQARMINNAVLNPVTHTI